MTVAGPDTGGQGGPAGDGSLPITGARAGQRIAGRALPARHYGSVDVFLEAYGGREE